MEDEEGFDPGELHQRSQEASILRQVISKLSQRDVVNAVALAGDSAMLLTIGSGKQGKNVDQFS
jgi:hypothetical protein